MTKHTDVGQSFGEDTALNSTKSQEVIEVVSEKAEVYRIKKEFLVKEFSEEVPDYPGCKSNKVIDALRAEIQAKKNWIQLKFTRLSKLNQAELLAQSALKDEAEFRGLMPTKEVPTEIPYLKMMQMQINDHGTMIIPKEEKTDNRLNDMTIKQKAAFGVLQQFAGTRKNLGVPVPPPAHQVSKAAIQAAMHKAMIADPAIADIVAKKGPPHPHPAPAPGPGPAPTPPAAPSTRFRTLPNRVPKKA